MTDRNVTLNDFFIFMKHLFYIIKQRQYTFVAESQTKVLT